MYKWLTSKIYWCKYVSGDIEQNTTVNQRPLRIGAFMLAFKKI